MSCSVALELRRTLFPERSQSFVTVLGEAQCEEGVCFHRHSLGQAAVIATLDRGLGEHYRQRPLLADGAQKLSRLLQGFSLRSDVIGDSQLASFFRFEPASGPDQFLGKWLADDARQGLRARATGH